MITPAHLASSVDPNGLIAVVDNIWVMLAVVVISALSSWFQNRNKRQGQPEPWGGEDADSAPSQRRGGGSTATPNPNQSLNWEEELKRLLEGKPPLDSTAGAPPPPPPPVLRREIPPPMPEPLSRESERVPEDSFPSRESSSPWKQTSLDSLPEPTKPVVTLGRSKVAYHRAKQLHETVAARMRQVNEQTEKHGKQPLRAPLPSGRVHNADARAVVSLLRQPATARQALLASFVLGPPKALEGR